MIKTVILDVDGTLVDSNNAHAQSWVDALRTEDIEARFLEVRRLIGMGGDRLLPAVSGIAEDTEQGKRISERRIQIFRENYLPNLKPFPKTRELLEKMKAEGLKLVVASSSDDDLLDELLRKAGVDDLIPKTTSKDDAETSKPAPDIVRAALRKARVEPHEALMLGDTPYDVEAAERAGVGCIALMCGGWEEDDLEYATAVYKDPADLLEHFETSPFVPRKGKDAAARTRARSTPQAT